ncbi:hypothetical protein DPQ33_02045 [Oceanidesulfovibrio indonesiensis]|uniref:PSP1 C-terminal domain-containing protein n=1 Tax=Oceanidesulfovibrio indonesiensis TaxID=54767 RepID=A0A7M3MKU8_9BACT|nr:regulatory iron-sulfur-containing complex subunit RicT [Oceanidesulfovibrio indonesiensis]TVM20032.1 hypothetical protein DPQ33_02045 [Oceanidesulfovibrio indonesiensis]
MSHILGLKFRDSGQIYYFDSGAFVVNTFDRVIVNTDQGMALAKVVLVLDELPEDFEGGEIKPIYRLATEEDLTQEKENVALGREAFEYCRKCIAEHKLDMKLVDVDVFFDRGKIVFYFTAPNRIDFRELVKDLVRTYRTRIELRQIGVRHETQMTGAVGNCGQLCCCRRFLRKFAPVTIKMAKEQNLFLNPTKISGICGRLLCCLAYEQENYEKFHAKCPRVGKRYMTERGGMKVLRANFFRDSLSVLPDGGEEEEIPIDDWEAMNPQRPDPNQQQQQHPQQQQQRAESKPKKDKPRKPKDLPDGETSNDVAPEVQAVAADNGVDAAQPDEAGESQQSKGDRSRREQKRGRRGSRGRTRDKNGEQREDRKGRKDSEREDTPREAAMPAGEVVKPTDGPTRNLPAVKTKGTFGISGLGAQPAKPQDSRRSGDEKGAPQEKAPKPEQPEAVAGGQTDQSDTQTEDKEAQSGAKESQGKKGRSRSSRRRPSRRSGRGRGGKKSSDSAAGKDSGDAPSSGKSADAKSSGDAQRSSDAGKTGGAEKQNSGQRRSRPRRRRKPKQDKPQE